MFPWITYNEFYKELSMFDEPNTIYAFIESIVNYNRDPKVKIKDLPSYARETIFDFDYPIAPELGKQKFEEMFLKHYMFRRINFDTLTSFKIHLEVKLNDIMPKYNKLVEGFDKIAFDGTIETHERSQNDSKNTTSSGESSVSSESSDESTSDIKYSDTPEGQLNNIKNGTYMSEYTLNGAESSGSSESQSSNTNTTNETGELLENITIKRGDPIEEYQKFMDIQQLNIYSMIFNECDSLFYGLAY